MALMDSRRPRQQYLPGFGFARPSAPPEPPRERASRLWLPALAMAFIWHWTWGLLLPVRTPDTGVRPTAPPGLTPYAADHRTALLSPARFALAYPEGFSRLALMDRPYIAPPLRVEEPPAAPANGTPVGPIRARARTDALRQAQAARLLERPLFSTREALQPRTKPLVLPGYAVLSSSLEEAVGMKPAWNPPDAAPPAGPWSLRCRLLFEGPGVPRQVLLEQPTGVEALDRYAIEWARTFRTRPAWTGAAQGTVTVRGVGAAEGGAP